MEREMRSATKTQWAVAAVVVVALMGVAIPLAFADNIGAPTSAAGGLSAPSSPSLSPAAGPLGSHSGSMSGGSIGRLHEDNDDSLILKLQPGTGKFEGPNNGTSTPCIGSTGFGSSGGIPGHKC